MKADPSLVASMAAAAADVSPAGKTFDMRGYSPSPSLAQNLFASYSALPAVTQAMYQPYMATSQFLPYPGAAGFSPNPVSAVQSDALNLSMPDRQRRNSSSSTAGGQSQPRPPSSAASSQGPTQHAGLAMDVRSSVGQQHLVIRDDDDDKMEDDRRSDYHTVERSNTTNAGSNTMPVVKVEPVVEGSASDTKPLHPANAREIGVQVTLCCARLPPHGNTTNASTNDQTNSGGGGDTPEGSPTPRGSKLESIQHETLATLMASGQLFRCPYCDCYFTDYAVFRIHQKYHEPDHPFTCTACKEDCRDKVYFAVHMYEHHRR
nr:hypothetical protein BaRGS_024143 [Batillaria attramentaria]